MKFAIFCIYENPELLFTFFISCYFTLFPNECRHRPGHSLGEKIKLHKMKNGKSNFGFSSIQNMAKFLMSVRAFPKLHFFHILEHCISSSSFCPELSASCLEGEPTNECSETSGAESLESKDKDPISAQLIHPARKDPRYLHSTTTIQALLAQYSEI